MHYPLRVRIIHVGVIIGAYWIHKMGEGDAVSRCVLTPMWGRGSVLLGVLRLAVMGAVNKCVTVWVDTVSVEVCHCL